MELNEEDYKYVIQDFSNVYLGARMTYQDMADREGVPGKIKDAVYRVFLKEVEPEMTIGKHLLTLKDDSVSYMAYHQLRVVVKVISLVKKKDKKGNEKETFEISDYTLDEFMKNAEIHENPEKYLIQEISIKKRNMMMLHV